MYNSRGQIKLESVLKCGQTLAEELVSVSKAPPGSPLLQQAEELRLAMQTQHNRAEELSSALITVVQSNTETINQLRPAVYARYRDKQCPEYFKDFLQKPTINIDVPSLKSKTRVSPLKKG